MKASRFEFNRRSDVSAFQSDHAPRAREGFDFRGDVSPDNQHGQPARTNRSNARSPGRASCHPAKARYPRDAAPPSTDPAASLVAGSIVKTRESEPPVIILTSLFCATSNRHLPIRALVAWRKGTLADARACASAVALYVEESIAVISPDASSALPACYSG
jgi:hypothetical protein